MSHSHHAHREHQVSHRRVAHILKDEPAGAKHHSKSHAFSKVTSKTGAEHHDKVSGHKAPKRYARGGKVKGHHTNINIVVPHRPAPPAIPLAGPTAGPAGAPPMAGPGLPPGLPPGGPGMPPPGGMPPGMPMRARGGKIDGESTKADIKQWAGRSKKNSYAKGGFVKPKVIDRAGASSGVGRLEGAEHQKHKKHK